MRKLLNFDYGFISVVFWLYYGVAITFASTLLLSKGFSNYRIGLIFTVANLTSFFCQPLLADLSDRSKVFHVHRVFEILAVVLLVGGITLFLPFAGKPVIFLVYVIMVALTMSLQGTLNALVFRMEESGEIINFGMCRAAGSFGFAIFSLTAGSLVTAFGPTVLLIGNVAIAGLLLLGLVLSELHLNRAKKIAAAAGTLTGDNHEAAAGEAEERITILQFAKKNKLYMIFSLGVFFIYISNAVLNNFMFQILTPLGGGARELGIFFAIMTFTEVPTLIFFNRLREKFGVRFLLKVAAIGFALRVLVVALAKNVVTVYLSMIFEPVSFPLFLAAAVIFIDEIMAKGESVKGQAFYTMMITFGAVVASYFGGLILDQGSVPFLLWLSTGITTVGALIVVFIVDRIPAHKRVAVALDSAASDIERADAGTE